ncbi:FtsX-like permease family protein [Noviherbaspirillum galbum]|uniref:FtsX-like permease family protein n=1 Tax=Noviherbaspirillum galbum TaxID=2709383 RepID=A0A6B3SLM6_9BURK|nr:FtsX-like permease family protein [Noviherbaspirillum galbum]NEX61680.1 FtsX-like permease family protein [Noviherbaspirillum galbum]
MKPAARTPWLLHRWLTLGEWRAHPVRAAVALLAIALGVALGFAIHLINAAAYDEFSAASRSLSGQADLQLRTAQASFDESVYPALASRPDVAVASPVVEIDAAVPGRQGALKLLGIDVFRAAAIAPDLIGVPAEDRPFDALADDAIFLSPAAMEWLAVRRGDPLRLQSVGGTVTLRVAGGLLGARPGQRLAVMDIAAAQWRFGRLGQLSRIDIKLAEGVSRKRFSEDLHRDLGKAYLVSEPREQEARTANMSRAYRVNLNVLALVALFTGAFLVFSTQALSVIRRRSQLALLRVVGMRRGQVMRQILMEGGSLGVLGSALGIAAGYGMAALALRFFGGDLGGGYFPGIQPSVEFLPVAATVFFLLGTGVAVAGCLSPALEAARARPAQALKSGSEDSVLSRLASPWPGLALLATGTAFSQLPPVSELPIFGYLAVALLLVGGIMLMPRMASSLFSLLARSRAAATALGTMTLGRLANAPNQASIALGGVLSSFSLMVAMAIMVASFRVSVDDWLGQVLAADLYARVAAAGNSAGLSAEQQRAIAAAPGVARAEFLRVNQLTLDPARPAVALIGRPINRVDPGKTLPLTGETLPPNAWRGVPIWVSEAMVDLYGYAVGKRVVLPLAGGTECIVAGVWRDYARQAGAIQMQLEDYRHLTGDTVINDTSLWLDKGATVEQVIAAIRKLPFGATLEFAQPGEIRAISLRIFDRSFAITYLLEGVAMVIGLFGVAATFSSQTLARVKEFGMLRHLGVTRRQILAMLAAEGGLLALLGILVGFVLGGAISLILIFVVNPQSFHWTMRLHLPWPLLGTVAMALLASACATAVVSGRFAVSGDAVRAVREDW